MSILASRHTYLSVTSNYARNYKPVHSLIINSTRKIK